VAATVAGTVAWAPPYSTAATQAAKPPDTSHQLQTKFSHVIVRSGHLPKIRSD